MRRQSMVKDGTYVRDNSVLVLELDTCLFGRLLSMTFFQVFGKWA